MEDGLDLPWDVAVLPGGDWLITERDRKRILIRRAGGSAEVLVDLPSQFISMGETGLMSIVVSDRIRRIARVRSRSRRRAGAPAEWTAMPGAGQKRIVANRHVSVKPTRS